MSKDCVWAKSALLLHGRSGFLFSGTAPGVRFRRLNDGGKAMLDFGGVVISRSRIAIIERRHETGLLIPVQRMDYYRVDRAWTAASDFSAWWHGLKVQQVNIYGHCALKPGIILTAGVELLNPVLYLHVVEIQMARLGEVTDTELLRLNYQDRAEYEADQRDARTPSRWLVWADVLEHD